jgi:hypothetical protein
MVNNVDLDLPNLPTKSKIRCFVARKLWEVSSTLNSTRLIIMQITAFIKFNTCTDRKINVPRIFWLLCPLFRGHKRAFSEIFHLSRINLVSLHTFYMAVIWPVAFRPQSHLIGIEGEKHVDSVSYNSYSLSDLRNNAFTNEPKNYACYKKLFQNIKKTTDLKYLLIR